MAKAKEYWPFVKEFFFDDDTFNIQKARTIELCEKLKPIKLTWSCTSRVTTDYETLRAMRDAGCRLLIVGYESGDTQILKNIKKGATLERARQFTRDCHNLGLTIHGDFILGLPGETRETIRQTISFAKEMDCETIQVSVAHAYPGTELHEFALRNGFIVPGSMVDEAGTSWRIFSIRICRRKRSWMRYIVSTMSITSGPGQFSALSAKPSSTRMSGGGCTKKPKAFWLCAPNARSTWKRNARRWSHRPPFRRPILHLANNRRRRIPPHR